VSPALLWFFAACIPITLRPVIKKRPERLGVLYISRPIFFVTICTRYRSLIPSLPRAHAAFEEYGRRGASGFGVTVGRYVIMPDHIHLFVCGTPDFVLSRWIGGLKRSMSKALDVPANFWQPGFFDHVLRSDERYYAKQIYIGDNPVRAGLVTESRHWPYQGDITSLE
jgi:REP-associated tyrosine transposase